MLLFVPYGTGTKKAPARQVPTVDISIKLMVPRYLVSLQCSTVATAALKAGRYGTVATHTVPLPITAVARGNANTKLIITNWLYPPCEK